MADAAGSRPPADRGAGAQRWLTGLTDRHPWGTNFAPLRVFGHCTASALLDGGLVRAQAPGGGSEL